MSFLYEVKYRGCVQVTHWQPSHAQPRPGLIEANACVKRIMSQEKQSTTVVLSASTETGVKCVDTNYNPPKTIMSNSVYEIAHCGVDVSQTKLFTLIVGTKGDHAMFFCHVFKTPNKETAAKVTRAVAQEHQSRKKQATIAPSPVSTMHVAPVADAVVEQRRQSYRRQSMKAPAMKVKARVRPKLTESWFRPSISRAEVQTALRGGRVGDFVVRESQSQPGDYAISVQTGKNIWTGLVLHSSDGFQLGNRGGVLFDELVDLIAFYCENKFMNDDFGFGLTLRMPPDSLASQVSMNQSPQRAVARKPTFKNPPVFGDLDAETDDMEGSPAGGYQPACGWPDSADEDEGQSFNPRQGTRNKDAMTEMSEADAFEAFMNAGGATSMGVTELDDALDNLQLAPPAGGDSSDEEENQPVRTPALTVDAVQPSRFDEPAEPAEPVLQQYAQHVFSLVPNKDHEDCLGGADVRPVLMKSGLEVGILGRIWMEVDQARRGKIDLDQLALVLGMISQAQQGQEPSLETLNPDKAAPPTLEGISFTPVTAGGAALAIGQRGRVTF